jgi:hypothetical protein
MEIEHYAKHPNVDLSNCETFVWYTGWIGFFFGVSIVVYFVVFIVIPSIKKSEFGRQIPEKKKPVKKPHA